MSGVTLRPSSASNWYSSNASLVPGGAYGAATSVGSTEIYLAGGGPLAQGGGGYIAGNAGGSPGAAYGSVGLDGVSLNRAVSADAGSTSTGAAVQPTAPMENGVELRGASGATNYSTVLANDGAAQPSGGLNDVMRLNGAFDYGSPPANGDIVGIATPIGVGYLDPVSGTGDTGAYSGTVGATGSAGIVLTQVGSISNSGTIAGGEGGAGTGYSVIASAGGTGVMLPPIVVMPIIVALPVIGVTLPVIGSGTAIGLGGAGTTSIEQYGAAGGAGGTGVVLYNGGSIYNLGLISGGQGGVGAGGPYTFGGAGGAGGTGIILSGGGSINNLGTIAGGQGGAGGSGQYQGAYGAAGNGIVLADGGTVSNGDAIHAGALIQGAIGIEAYYSAAGATVTNYGTIASVYGAAGVAVQFGGSNDALIIEAGSQLIGSAFGGGGTLELAGGAGAGTLSGLGGQYYGFSQYAVLADASWTLTGYNAITAGALLTDNGTLCNTGVLTVQGNGVLLAGGYLDNTVSGTIVAAYGAAAVYGTGGPNSLANAGVITGGPGTAGGSYAGYYNGGAGTAGGSYVGYYNGGAGGAGIVLSGGGSIGNSGAIVGGAGGAGWYAGAGGAGGVGIILSGGGSIGNTGTIAGGQGGIGGYGQYAAPGTAGNGIVLAYGGVVSNGNATHPGALIEGALGIWAYGAAGATVTNYGTIASVYGAAGVAVQFGGSNDALIIEAGSQLIGSAFGGGGTLDLAGGAGAGTLSGLGSQYVGFSQVVVLGGANWTLTGSGDVSSISVAADSEVTLQGAVAAGQTLNFIGDTGLAALDAPLLFAGTITGFQLGDTIDLENTAVTGLSYSGADSGGILTVLDGSTTVASLAFSGSYSDGEFQFSSDRNGGDDISLASLSGPASSMTAANADTSPLGFGFGDISAAQSTAALLSPIANDTFANSQSAGDLHYGINAVTPGSISGPAAELVDLLHHPAGNLYFTR